MHWFNKITRPFRRARWEAEMADEMKQHIELLAEAKRSSGLSPDEARIAAHREFGNVASLQERAREQTGWPGLENRLRDCSHALRRLRQSPGFALVALGTLALGIGANTAVYSIVRGVALRPLVLPDPDRVVVVQETNPHTGGQIFSVSVPNFHDWRERSKSFSEIVAVSNRHVNLTGAGEPMRIAGRHVSRGYLRLLGLPPLRGRDFHDDEDRLGSNNVVLLTESFWRAQFGGDPSIVGRSLQINGRAHEVVGVAQDGPAIGGTAEVLIPLGADLAKEERDNHEIDVIGRLAPGTSLTQAQAELAAIAVELGRAHPKSNAGWGVRMRSLHDTLVPDGTRRTLWVLLAAVGLLLGITCVNLASMQLARAVARERELAVCAALGGSRGRLVTQLLTESLLLAVLGGALGVLLAFGLVDAWRGSWLAAAVPRAGEVGVDAGVLAFALVIAMLAGLLSGVLPARRANQVDVRTALQAAGRGSAGGRQRALRIFVVGQVALSFVLLGAAALLVRSLGKLGRQDLGFNPANVLTVRLAPTNRAQEFFTQLHERVRALPGVRAVGLTSGLPLEGFITSLNVRPVGPTRLATGQMVQAEWRVVRDDYLGALGIALRRGRTFTPADGEKAPKVVLVNETLARQVWGEENPVGRQLDLGGDGGEPATVVGVVADIRNENPGRAPEPAFYFSAYLWLWGHMTLVVRTDGDPKALVPMIRDEVKALDPVLPLYRIRTMEEQVATSLGEARLLAVLVGGFGLLAAALAAVGVAGVTAFTVGTRTREIGVRLALGAEPQGVVGLIQRENSRLLLWGLLLGALAFAAAGRALGSQLHGVGPLDPLAWSLAGGLVALAALLAGWLPARRASRVDPLVALRME